MKSSHYKHQLVTKYHKKFSLQKSQKSWLQSSLILAHELAKDVGVVHRGRGSERRRGRRGHGEPGESFNRFLKSQKSGPKRFFKNRCHPKNMQKNDPRRSYMNWFNTYVAISKLCKSRAQNMVKNEPKMGQKGSKKPWLKNWFNRSKCQLNLPPCRPAATSAESLPMSSWASTSPATSPSGSAPAPSWRPVRSCLLWWRRRQDWSRFPHSLEGRDAEGNIGLGFGFRYHIESVNIKPKPS